VCWSEGGSQRPAGIVAVFGIAIIAVGLPLVSLAALAMWMLRKRRGKSVLSGSRPAVASVGLPEQLVLIAAVNSCPIHLRLSSQRLEHPARGPSSQFPARCPASETRVGLGSSVSTPS